MDMGMRFSPYKAARFSIGTVGTGKLFDQNLSCAKVWGDEMVIYGYFLTRIEKYKNQEEANN